MQEKQTSTKKYKEMTLGIMKRLNRKPNKIQGKKKKKVSVKVNIKNKCTSCIACLGPYCQEIERKLRLSVDGN